MPRPGPSRVCPVAGDTVGGPRTGSTSRCAAARPGKGSPLAIRDILRYGDPRLVAENETVTAREGLAELIADMVETCHAAPGVGLAAPQIGVNRRVAIIDLSVGADPGAVLVLVNPVILESSGEQKEEEGCLSIPDCSEKVLRPARVRVRAEDAAGVVARDRGDRAARPRPVPRDRPPEPDALRRPPAGLEARVDVAQDPPAKSEGDLVSVTVFNTLGRRMVEIEPLEPGHVRMYTCGPTVYNAVHIGNLRTFLWEDVLRRHLKARYGRASRRS